MVHQMMLTSLPPAPGALSSSKFLNRLLAWVEWLCVVGTLVACTSTPLVLSLPPESSAQAPVQQNAGAATASTTLAQPRSRWVRADWADLPGFAEDTLFEAWNAWIKSCERAVPAFVALCRDVRGLSIAEPEVQRAWLRQHLQPYRVESLQGDGDGLLTGYFEPMLEASRLPSMQYPVPLYEPPATLSQRTPWFSRQEIDTSAQAQSALAGRAIAYLADPVDALILQIQGSGRLHMAQGDGSYRWVRLAFAGTNGQPYRSVGRWLLDQGLIRDASWPGIKAWLGANPQRQQEVLWSNPRVVFFREEPIADIDAAWGPRGAQGVALTPGRSIAVDPGSVPYGTPVWLASQGPQVHLQKLVLAQDTGSAITGAVRADYFTGWGSQAAELAGRLRQPLQMWVLWPK
jgi:membrane-bound lytic murein transglycosylase A